MFQTHTLRPRKRNLLVIKAVHVAAVVPLERQEEVGLEDEHFPESPCSILPLYHHFMTYSSANFIL